MKERNNQPNNDFGGGWDVREAMQPGGTCRGGHLPIIGGGRIERCKNKNRESDGASIFDGFQWMGGCDNQPRVSTIDGTWSGERDRRTLMMGVDTVASFLLSN